MRGSTIRRHLSRPERATTAPAAFGLEAAAVLPTNCPATWEPLLPGSEELPMLDPPGTPRDEAVALLHATAEIEHSLMVQYLYAAYSLGDVDPADPQHTVKQLKVRLIRHLLLHIAREEMAHLATVQNLLHLLGAPLHLDREHSPFASQLLPFRFKLEPISLGSLAKYVIAESPRPLPDDGSVPAADAALIMGEVTDQARASNDGICPGHVGDIFARLIWLFSAPPSGASDDERTRRLADEDFRPDTQDFQAAWEDWGFEPKDRTFGSQTIQASPSLVRQFSGSDAAQLRNDAVSALRAIAEQGEGTDPASGAAPMDGSESHFEWFWLIYKTFKELDQSPAGAPVHQVPINPNTSAADAAPKAPFFKMVDAGLQAAVDAGRITHPRARRWAQLFNLRYRALLLQLHHFLRIDTPRYDAAGDRTARGYLLIGVFNEMRRLKKIAGKLVRLPKTETPGDPHRAGAPFELPYTTQLPDGEAARWRGHLDTSRAAAALLDEMLQDPADQQDGFLIDLKEADEADQIVMTALAAGDPLPPQSQDFPKIVRILEEAVRGFTIGAPHSNMWAEVDLTDFKGLQPQYGSFVTPGDAANSMLLRVLRGTATDVMGYMPRERPPVPASRIDYIENWITRPGNPCPDSVPPYPGLVREREPADEAAAPSFAADIRPLFTPSDVSCMKMFGGFDLSKYDDVKNHAANIHARLDLGDMPPNGRWPQADIDRFKAWMDAGFPP